MAIHRRKAKPFGSGQVSRSATICSPTLAAKVHDSGMLQMSLTLSCLIGFAVVDGKAATLRFVVAGKPTTQVQSADGWESKGGFYVSTKSTRLTPAVGIGEGDFRIFARVQLEKMDRSACGLVLAKSFFGFEGAHGKMFVTGKLFDGARGLPVGDPDKFMQDGRAFDFEVRRVAKRIRFSIDGKTVLERPFTDQAIGSFSLVPSRAVIAVSEFRAEGNLAAKYLNHIPLEQAYQMKNIPGVQKNVLLPPGPGNPRNSEGDFIPLKDGRVLFVYTHFTGGGSDHASGHLAGRYSSDGGVTWTKEDVVVLANEGGFNVMSVSLLRLQGGDIALFYLRKNSLEDCRPQLRISKDEAKTWSEPMEVITDEVGYYVMNNDRVIQTKTGRLVCPVALHNTAAYAKPDWDGTLMCYFSDDKGVSWRRSQSVLKGVKPDGKRITFQEPGVVELADGRIMLFVRTGEGSQYLAWSKDGGNTWSQPQASNIRSPKSPATIERIPGRKDLLMAWNDHSDIPTTLKGKRTPLAVAVSSDSGKTWKRRHVLEDDPNGWYCYIAMCFVEGKVLLGHCAGDWRVSGLGTTQITRFDLGWLD
ncbi:MAG: sialidase-1 [Limisphaerales bacterium]